MTAGVYIALLAILLNTMSISLNLLRVKRMLEWQAYERRGDDDG